MTTHNDATHKVLSKYRWIEVIALWEKLAGFLLPQICGHDKELSVQRRFSRLRHCRGTQRSFSDPDIGAVAWRQLSLTQSWQDTNWALNFETQIKSYQSFFFLVHLPSLKSLLASSKTSVSLLLDGLSMSSRFSENNRKSNQWSAMAYPQWWLQKKMPGVLPSC